MSATYRLLVFLFTILWANFVFKMIVAGYTEVTIISIVFYVGIVLSLETYRVRVIEEQEK